MLLMNFLQRSTLGGLVHNWSRHHQPIWSENERETKSILHRACGDRSRGTASRCYCAARDCATSCCATHACFGVTAGKTHRGCMLAASSLQFSQAELADPGVKWSKAGWVYHRLAKKGVFCKLSLI